MSISDQDGSCHAKQGQTTIEKLSRLLRVYCFDRVIGEGDLKKIDDDARLHHVEGDAWDFKVVRG